MPKKSPSGEALLKTGEPAVIGLELAERKVMGAAPTPV